MMFTSQREEEDEVNKILRSLRWEDTFFDQEEGLIAVFDFDYEKIASFSEKVWVASTISALLYPPVYVLLILSCCVCGEPCLYKERIAWDVYSRHVAVTRDGIKYVQDKRKAGCGYDCQDKGKVSKTVPFDKITDADVHEPAGATCCCVQNVLSIVAVDTASGRDLTLVGLKEPYELKKLVWAMKRANARGTTAFVVPFQSPMEASARGIELSDRTSFVVPLQPPMEASEGGIEVSAPRSYFAPIQSTMDREFSNEETNAILRDIRSELIELNANIKIMDK